MVSSYDHAIYAVQPHCLNTNPCTVPAYEHWGLRVQPHGLVDDPSGEAQLPQLLNRWCVITNNLVHLTQAPHTQATASMAVRRLADDAVLAGDQRKAGQWPLEAIDAKRSIASRMHHICQQCTVCSIVTRACKPGIPCMQGAIQRLWL
jgi:hypothetical protein